MYAKSDIISGLSVRARGWVRAMATCALIENIGYWKTRTGYPQLADSNDTPMCHNN